MLDLAFYKELRSNRGYYLAEREVQIEKDNLNLLAKLENIKKKGTNINVGLSNKILSDSSLLCATRI